MRYRFVAPPRLEKQMATFDKDSPTDAEIERLNNKEYCIYYFPNYNSKPVEGALRGKDVDIFHLVFVDMDLKDGIYKSKEEFLELLKAFPLKTRCIIDSGHGIHAYWKISDLDAMTYLHIQKGLISHFKTDKSVWKICQLMRAPGYLNTKPENREDWKEVCILSKQKEFEYTVEQMLSTLPSLTTDDEHKILEHYNKTVLGIETPLSSQANVGADLPPKFSELLEKNERIQELFYVQKGQDRSTADMKLANILKKSAYTKEEVTSVILNGAKGSERGLKYASELTEKVFKSPLQPLDEDYVECKDIVDKTLINRAKQDVKRNIKRLLKKLKLRKGRAYIR
jgi:hypothetical protein